MKKITNSELKQIQLEILKNVHSFCTKHNIRYTIAYGTLLGAVRHQGFIPWDNDIDIAMLRKDYERFVAEYKDDIYVLYELRTDPECEIPYAKVYDSRTMLIEHSNSKCIGVNIDIFPIDDLYDDYMRSVKEFNSFRCYKIQRMLIGREPSSSTTWWKSVAYRVGKYLLIGKTLRSVGVKISTLAKRQRTDNSEYLSLLTGNSLNYRNNIMHRRVFNSFHLMKFENHLFYGLNNYNEYLTICYGDDYMQLPPEEQRITPHLFDNVYWK